MKKGISLITLIITIVAMIILASLAITGSLNSVDEAQKVKSEKEFNDVCDFVRSISSKVDAGMIELNMTNSTYVTEAQLEKFYVDDPKSEFTAEDQQNIFAANESGRNPNLGYHYIKGSQIENNTISGLDGVSSNISGIKNDYIINFTYGVVVAKISNTETKISGRVR